MPAHVLAGVLAEGRLVDLTQPLGPDTALWPGSSPFAARVTATHERDGLYARELTLPEHAGTHLDAPAHFGPGGATVDRLPLSALVRPAVVLDVRERCGGDPRFSLSRADVEELEGRDGVIPAGSAVLVCTGWSARLADAAAYGVGDPPAFPGLAPDAAGLIVERGAAGIGIDTLGVDPGHATETPVHRITQPAGLWHLEGLVALERLPARGAWLVVGAPPLVDGSGVSVRAFAVLPG